MFFDFQEVSLTYGMIAFPDYPFAAQPRPEPITEQKFLTGSDTATVHMTGALDDQE